MRTKLLNVCCICGESGCFKLLMSCSDCNDRHVHKACLSIDAATDWTCGCSPSMEPKPSISQSSRIASVNYVEEKCEEEDAGANISESHHQEELCMSECSKNEGPKRKRAELAKVCCVCGGSGFSELLRPSSVCFGHHVHVYCLVDVVYSWEDNDEFDCGCLMEHAGAYQNESECQIILVEDQPKPLRVLRPNEHLEEGPMDHASKHSKERSLHASSFMEGPKEIMRGVVLVVNPRGKVIVHKGMSSCDDSNSPNLDTIVKQLASYNLRSRSTMKKLLKHSGPYNLRSRMGATERAHMSCLPDYKRSNCKRQKISNHCEVNVC